MKLDGPKAQRLESEYLAGVESNFESAKGRFFRGATWKRTEDDEKERVRALMAGARLFDRSVLASLPSNRRVALQGFERRFFFGRRRTGVAVASVINPLPQLVAGTDTPQVTANELQDHVRRLVVDERVPHVIGVCGPAGFSPEARRVRLDLPNVTVVLTEPDSGGGWRVSGLGEVDPRLLKIFDPETANDKVERVRRFAEEHSAELLTGGLSASFVAEKLELSADVVQRGFEEAATRDGELRVARRDGEHLLFRGAPVAGAERKPQGMIDRIRQLFAREADSAAKFNLLAERRAALAQRRDRMYEDIAKLEEREADLLAQGRATTSQVSKRRLAAQLAQLRKDIARENTAAAMLNQQINIISTDIHNLTLIQQGELAQLPDTKELTENAVRAEEMLESLKADSELVSSLETGLEATLTNDEELAILREFEEPKAEAQPPAKTAERDAPRSAPEPRSPIVERAKVNPPEGSKKRGAEPEAS